MLTLILPSSLVLLLENDFRNLRPGSLDFPPSKLVDAIGGSLGVSLDLLAFDLYSPSDTDEPESLDLILRTPEPKS